MSLALGKKLNSQIADVPLNHLIWLNDYKTYGYNSYTYYNKNIFDELCRSCAGVNDPSMASDLKEFFVNNNSKVGKALSQIYGLEHSSDLAAIDKIENIYESQYWDSWYLNDQIKKILGAAPIALIKDGVINSEYSNSDFYYEYASAGSATYNESEKALELSVTASIVNGYSRFSSIFSPKINLTDHSTIIIESKKEIPSAYKSGEFIIQFTDDNTQGNNNGDLISSCLDSITTDYSELILDISTVSYNNYLKLRTTYQANSANTTMKVFVKNLIIK